MEHIKILLAFLVGVTRGFQKYIICRVFGPKSPSRTSVTLEDIKMLLASLIGVKVTRVIIIDLDSQGFPKI